MHALELEGPKNIIAILTSSGRERDIACWHTCSAIDRDLEQYKPPAFASAPDWKPEHQALINSLRFMDREQFEDTARQNPAVFGAYRNAVLNHEGEGARRLQTLVWALRELYRMRDIPDANTALLEPPANRISAVLAMDWKLSNVPLDGDYRAWATRSGRRYDLCPKSWRAL